MKVDSWDNDLSIYLSVCLSLCLSNLIWSDIILSYPILSIYLSIPFLGEWIMNIHKSQWFWCGSPGLLGVTRDPSNRRLRAVAAGATSEANRAYSAGQRQIGWQCVLGVTSSGKSVEVERTFRGDWSGDIPFSSLHWYMFKHMEGYFHGISPLYPLVFNQIGICLV